MNTDPNRTVPRGAAPSATVSLAPGAPAELGAVGRFRVLSELGRGGMGAVYRARDPELGREVALKVLLPELAADARAKARFLREARAQARVEHDHIVPIHDVGETEGFAYLVMPLLKGQTLKDALKKGARPPVPEVVRIGREIAEGLAAAHAAGLIHRDIKPGNVWLEGDKRRVKILDFGLARAASDTPDPVPASRPQLVSAELTAAGGIVGTPAYMSPEQARGLAVDARSDVFSLGVVLYELASGRKPFNGSSPFDIMAAVVETEPFPLARLVADLPPALADLISRMLAKDPAARPPACARVAAELAALAVPQVVALPLQSGGAPSVWEDLTAAADTSPAERTELAPPAPRAARPRWPWAVGAAVLFAAVAAGAAILSRGKPTEQARADPEQPKAQVPKLPSKPEPKPLVGDEVLFDGTAASFAKWRSLKTGGEATWDVKDGFMVVMPGRGNIHTAERFGDHVIHLEYWLLPNENKGGNSGVYVHGCYEVSIAEDAGQPVTNTTSGGIYGQHAPLRNASKPAGQWQTLDITFTAARAKQLPRITVVHNGERVLDGAELTAHSAMSAPHLMRDNAGPIMLQDHGARVRFRDIRVRRSTAPVATLTRDQFVAEVAARGGELTWDEKPVPAGAKLPDGVPGYKLGLKSGTYRPPVWVGQPNWAPGRTSAGKVASPFGDGELAPLETFPPGSFAWLLLSGQRLADPELERVIGYPSMRAVTVLWALDCDAGAGTVRAAARLPKLEGLALDRTQVRDADLAPLPGDLQALRLLALRGRKVSNGALPHLKRLGTLQSLDLRDTDVTEAGARELAAALPGCWIAYGTDQRIEPAKK